MTFSARFLKLAAASLCVGALSQPGFAQELQEPQSVWEHELSGLRLAEQIGSFTRGESNYFDAEGYNIGIKFFDNEQGTWADVYVYRAGDPSVAMWGDRAMTAMLTGETRQFIKDGGVTRVAFTPPNGAGEQSGVRVVAELNGDISSTGLALYAHDGWLIKVRMTSYEHDGAALHAQMETLVNGLELPTATQQAPQFSAIRQCEDEIKYKRNARLVQLDMMANILVPTMLSTAREKAAEEPRPTPNWCRDASSVREYAIYRNSQSDDSYTLALGDSGTSISVSRFDFGELISPSRGFLVTQSNGVTEVLYPPLTKLPRPAIVAGLQGNVSPISSFDLRPGGEGGQTIMVPSGE